jgi:hypothetical protein
LWCVFVDANLMVMVRHPKGKGRAPTRDNYLAAAAQDQARSTATTGAPPLLRHYSTQTQLATCDLRQGREQASAGRQFIISSCPPNACNPHRRGFCAEARRVGMSTLGPRLKCLECSQNPMNSCSLPDPQMQPTKRQILTQIKESLVF